MPPCNCISDFSDRLLAEPNSLIVESSIRQLTGETFGYTDLGEHTLEDLVGPLHIWRVQGVPSAASRFERHSTALTPLVGRQAELQLLRDRCAQVASSEGQVVLLTGEAGIGKSRIVHELLATLDPETIRSRCYQCSPYHCNTALHPFIAYLNQQLTQQAKGTPQDRTEQLLALAETGGQTPEQAVPLLAALLSIPVDEHYPTLQLSAEQQKQATLALLSRMTLSGAGGQPLLIVVEDIHWLDPSSGELLVRLIDAVQTTPALLILTTRPEFSAEWPHFTHVTALTLNRLSREQALMMAGAIAAKTMPPSVSAHIADETDGVPLFVEEMAKAVLESDVVVEQADRYTLASNNALTAVIPATLQDTLMARLDRLGPVKKVAQIGAVIGREFSYELLTAVSNLPEAELRAGLDSLVSVELMFRRGTPPFASYIFKHALVQDATYDSLLRAKRQQLHARIAQALELRFPETVEKEPELLAQHYTGAGLYQQAITYWQKAGEHAAQRSANPEAVNHFRRGLELVATFRDDTSRARTELGLQLALGSPLIATKGYTADDTVRAFVRARALCEQLGEVPKLFQAIYGTWANHAMRGEHERARELAEEFLSLAEQHGEVAPAITGHRILGWSLSLLGQLPAGKQQLERTLSLYDSDKHRSLAYRYGQDPRIAALSILSWNTALHGYPDTSLVLGAQALREAKELNHAFTLAYATYMAGAVPKYLIGDLAGSKADVDMLITFSHKQSFPFWLAYGNGLRRALLVRESDTEDVMMFAERTLSDFEQLGIGWFRPFVLCSLADGHLASGRSACARDLIVQALAIVNDTDERWIEPELYRLKGEVMLLDGRRCWPKAESCFRRAIDLAQSQSTKFWELRTATSLARLWRDQDKHREAVDLLAPVYNWFTEGFDTANLKDAKALLEELQ